MEYQTIISIRDLEQHLGDQNWVIIDCRFDLANPDKGFADYEQSHIPFAVYCHLDHDLAGPISPQTGRHPLPDPKDFAKKLSTWGINTQKQVIVYDTSNGGYASRLWWMLQSLGHAKTAVLNGGFTLWERNGLSIKSGNEINQPENYSLSNDAKWNGIVTIEEVEKLRLDPIFKLVDARSPERYNGEKESIDPIAGHIPGAFNRFHGDNLQEDGTLKMPHVVREEFIRLLGNTPPDHTIVYCGSGVTSCFHILAMNYSGLIGAKLYPGSWSEWIRDPSRTRIP